MESLCQHSGLREDNNKINSLFNYPLSHALTAGRAIVPYRVWRGSRASAAPNNRARLTRHNGQPKVGSTSLSLVRVKRGVSMAEETSMAQVLLLMQQQMAAQQWILERMAEAPPLAQQAATAAAAAPPEARPPAIMKIDFEKFSGEPEDWNAWSKVYMVQISALGGEDVLTTSAAQDIKVGAETFDGSQVHPEMLRKAKQVWDSLITNCKGVAFEIVQGADSPSQAWRQLVQHYKASGVKEWRRLALGFYSMKMEPVEHPRQICLRVARLVKEMKRVGRPALEKDVDIVLLTGLSTQYDAEF